MEINITGLKYLKWQSIGDLHEDILKCISELRFIKDEQQFLEDLIKSYTLNLLKETSYENSKAVIGELALLRKELPILLKKSIRHSNNLETLLNEVDFSSEMEIYKKEHEIIVLEVTAYASRFKKSKRKIFGLIKQILKAGKEKRLLR
jgi:hypothetical protein